MQLQPERKMERYDWLEARPMRLDGRSFFPEPCYHKLCNDREITPSPGVMQIVEENNKQGVKTTHIIIYQSQNRQAQQSQFISKL